jgi:retron-type reverse transcriptase
MNVQYRSTLSKIIANYYIHRINSLNRQIAAIETVELRNYKNDHFYQLKKAKVRYQKELRECESQLTLFA